MAKSVIWSEKAIDDLNSIAHYIARDSTQNASAVVKKILATAASLSQFPHLGAIVPELADPAIRERKVFRYRIIYRVRASEALILAVLHSRRSFVSLRRRLRE
ncbi:type II toxin-antitoxin system RelE/ParE family toxin [Pseudoduganella aquatica]|uniref:Type II toxin-antitoxin system RelE/ParE family toxin n=1 Tax=Pseudoduganella aquatica TaxID=2660641 RepID=A0A7X4H9Y0_9BURK|nr:type II toxin-antitoxin system RelE/ParE family toxin [Pseudoduganella aquatica]MYN07353.1 type II toxin-antitoxin system RelE/ParE family toxin [Pseudoduganella aquatica]